MGQDLVAAHPRCGDGAVQRVDELLDMAGVEHSLLVTDLDGHVLVVAGVLDDDRVALDGPGIPHLRLIDSFGFCEGRVRHVKPLSVDR